MPKRKTRRKPNKKRTKKTTFARDKQNEIFGLLLILTGVLIFIALYSYVPEETPASLGPAHMIQNDLGWAGVYIAHYLVRWTIGYPVLIFPFLIIAWGLNQTLNKNTRQLWRWTWLSLLFSFYISVAFALSEALSVAPDASPTFDFSGRLGGLGAQFLIMLFGNLGSVVILIGIILLTVLVSTTLSLSEVLSIVERVVVRTFYRISNFVSGQISAFKNRRKQRPQPSISKPHWGSDSIETKESLFEQETSASRQTRPKINFEEQTELFQSEEDEEENEEEVKVESDAGVLSTMEFERVYQKPPLDLLRMPERSQTSISDEALHLNAQLLEEKLEDFGIRAKVVEIHPGPIITLYEIKLAPGIRVSRIMSLSDDLAMAMRAKRVRILAPIPGRATIGIEIPNPAPETVYLREIIQTPEFQKKPSPLTFAIGKTISGKPYISNLDNMPHLLIAGATGSGKSVCLNTIITSFLYKASPAELQFLMIDPKRLELSNYSKLYKHHLTYVEGSRQKVATNAKTAIQMLKSAEMEMDRRYDLLSAAGIRNMEEYNARIRNETYAPEGEDNPQPLPYLIVIVDELADLMLTSSAAKDVEEPIARLAQMSRAVGLHLIVATQRPSVDVITGLIKANFPARIAFQVAQKNDSRIIMDMNGAEKLLGRGDMLFLPPASPEPIRLHNAFISSDEIEEIIEFVRHQPTFDKQPLKAYKEEEEETSDYMYDNNQRDPLFDEAVKVVVRTGQGSVSIIQRKLKVGYSRAARIIDQLESAGIVGPFEGSKAREVLMTPEELEAWSGDEENENL